MTPYSQVTTDIHELLEENSTVVLLNNYKGVPVNCPAEIDRIDNNSAILRVKVPESTSLVWERYAWFHSERASKVVRARVNAFDIVSGRLVLGDFRASSSRLAERSALRVEPRNTIPVSIESESQRVVGALADISVIGIGVYVYALEPEHLWHRAESVQLTMQLPNGQVTINGKIRGMVKPADFYRLAVNFNKNDAETEKIAVYVEQRRKEILEEIPRLYKTLVQSNTGDPR